MAWSHLIEILKMLFIKMEAVQNIFPICRAESEISMRKSCWHEGRWLRGVRAAGP